MNQLRERKSSTNHKSPIFGSLVRIFGYLSYLRGGSSHFEPFDKALTSGFCRGVALGLCRRMRQPIARRARAEALRGVSERKLEMLREDIWKHDDDDDDDDDDDHDDDDHDHDYDDDYDKS